MQRTQHLGLFAVVLLSCSQEGNLDPDGTMGGGDDASADGPDFEVLYRTRYVDVAPGFAQPVCRGTLDEIDRHIDMISGLLDVSVVQRTTLFWYNEHATGALVDADSSRIWCPTSSACYRDGGIVHTNMRALHHELVHAVVSPSWGRSDIVFSEGVAMGLDREAYAFGSTSVHSLLTDERPTDVAGGTQHGGGHFSRWLIERDGPATLRELFEPRLSASSTRDEVFAAVAEVYGVPFDDLEAEYFATAPTIYPAPGLCDGLVNIPWNGDRWELRITADCDAPHMFGPLDVDASKPPEEPAPMATVVTVDIPPDLDGVPLTAWIPSDEGVELWPCFDEPLYDVDPKLAQGKRLHQSTAAPLPAGRYRLELPVYEPGDVYVRICPHNGAPPKLDPAEDPGHCRGD